MLSDQYIEWLVVTAYLTGVLGSLATLRRGSNFDPRWDSLIAAVTWPIFWPCYAVWRLVRRKPKRSKWPPTFMLYSDGSTILEAILAATEHLEPPCPKDS